MNKFWNVDNLINDKAIDELVRNPKKQEDLKKAMEILNKVKGQKKK